VPVSWGDLIDKITILEIKVERLNAPLARQNAAHELACHFCPQSGRHRRPSTDFPENAGSKAPPT
jgi:hypothetical protein